MNRNPERPPFINSVVFTNLDSLRRILTEELILLGVDKSVLIILDSQHNPIFHFHQGFSVKQLDFYVNHMDQDEFLIEYLRHGMSGKFSYFADLFSKTQHQAIVHYSKLCQYLDIRHPFGGMYSLPHNHVLLFSAYTPRTPSEKQIQGIDSLWHYIVTWAASWCEQIEMEESWKRLQSYSQKSNNTYDLTIAEKEVLILLSHGHDINRIARYRNVSKETVRSQIKQILKKTNCSSQIQLLSAFFHGSLNHQ